MVKKLIKLALAQQRDGCSQRPSDGAAVWNRSRPAEPEEVETPLPGGLHGERTALSMSRRVDAPATHIPDD